MKKIVMIIGVISIVFIIVSCVTAAPQIKNNNIDKILDKKNMGLLNEHLNYNNSFINLIIKLLQFFQNILSIVLAIFTPLLPLLESIEIFLGNLLEFLEPWGILGEAILGVINSIYTLIEAIQNIIDPPLFNKMI